MMQEDIKAKIAEIEQLIQEKSEELASLKAQLGEGKELPTVPDFDDGLPDILSGLKVASERNPMKISLVKPRCFSRLIGPTEENRYAPRCRNSRKDGNRFCDFHEVKILGK